MEDYDFDLPADAVVAWIVRAVEAGGSGLEIDAWREYVATGAEVAATQPYEDSAVSEAMTVGSLEVRPGHRSDTWVLKVRVEDELADRVPADEDTPEGPEAISLQQFWDDFIAPGRGTQRIWVAAAGPKEKQAFDRFLRRLERRAIASHGGRD